MLISDCSSDVCSSDLADRIVEGLHAKSGQRIFEQDPDAAFARLHRMHVVLLTLGLISVFGAVAGSHGWRSEERRVGKACVIRVDLGGRRRIIKKQNEIDEQASQYTTKIHVTHS